MSSTSCKTMVAPKTVIMGMGNSLLTDEGVGVHLVQLLAVHVSNYANLTLVDGGTSPDALLLADKADKLIVLDAVRNGKKPGTVHRFGAENIEAAPIGRLSLHQWGIADSLRMLALLGKQPETIVIIGIEPEVVNWGVELSPAIKSKMPEVIRLVLEEIEGNKLNREETNDNL